MTNVKLKLMFFLLSALLTADIVHARPYSDNATDIVYNYNSNDTYLPVEANTDTLIVKYNEEEVSRKANNNMDAMMTAEQDRDDDLSKKVMVAQLKPEDSESNQKPNLHLDQIITAEQDRDRELSRKINKDQSKFKVSRKDADSFEKQMNISSPFLEELIDSETDREETLTDILFRGRSEAFVEPPRFEFLIAAKINESELTNKSVSGRSDNALDRGDKNSSDMLRKVDYVELVEVLKAGKPENKSAYNLLNITANEVDNDLAPDTILSVFSGFSDMQTLVLACFGTLLPLLAVLCSFFLIRCMCRRWCPDCCSKKSDISESDSSEKNDTNQQIKSEEAGEPVENGDGHAANSNGSIFTMTMKNNHLIVETEERNDFTKNGRETKLKYSPDNDGIFVVEVQQSAAYRPNNTKSIQNSPPHDPQISTNQALIHRVPEELEKKLEEDSEQSSTKFDKEKALALSSTGLSISDLSMSSIGSHNGSYSYGSQMGYQHGPFGYPIYAGYDTKDDNDDIVHENSQEPLISKTPTDPDRPVVTAAIFKQDSLISNDVLQGQIYCIEGSSDGPLLSDAQAREVSLQNLQHKKLENGVAVPISEKIESPRKPFNRADSLPVRLQEQNIPEPVVNKNPAMDIIKENDMQDAEMPKDFLKGKRGSLPIIRTDMYESVKDVMMPVGSPKFEMLMNDGSPGDGMYEPPMITITEEAEPGKSDS